MSIFKSSIATISTLFDSFFGSELINTSATTRVFFATERTTFNNNRINTIPTKHKILHLVLFVCIVGLACQSLIQAVVSALHTVGDLCDDYEKGGTLQHERGHAPERKR